MVPTSWAMDDAAHTHRPFINLFPHSGQLRISMTSCVMKLPSSSSTLTLNIPCLFTAISMPLYSTAWFIGTKSFVPDSQYGHLIELTFHVVFFLYHLRNTTLVAPPMNSSDFAFMPKPFIPRELAFEMKIMLPLVVQPHPVWARNFIQKCRQIHNPDSRVSEFCFNHFNEAVAIKLHTKSAFHTSNVLIHSTFTHLGTPQNKA